MVISRISRMFQTIPERPANFWRIGLSPPSIEFRQVQATIHQNFHAAGSAGFPRAPRCVQPQIYPLNHFLRQSHVVIGEEYDFPYDILTLAEADPARYHSLPLLITRMSFT